MTNKYDGTVEVVSSPIIINAKGEILLIKSHKWGDKYLIPGGHVELGEPILDAAKREGEEETGLRLEPQYCVNIGENIFDADFHRKAHLVYFHVACKALTEDVRLDGTELQEFIWIAPQEALKLELVKGIRESVENYIKGVWIPIMS